MIFVENEKTATAQAAHISGDFILECLQIRERGKQASDDIKVVTYSGIPNGLSIFAPPKFALPIRMKIAIIGSGAVGSFYGGNLALTGECEVHFLMRADLDRVSSDGLFLKSETRGDVHLPSVNCHAATEEIGPADLVIVALESDR